MPDLGPQSSVLGPPSSARAMLAICSDLDETPDAETYFELMRFLNTTEETSMGQGVGLEVGNTIYFDMPPGHFSYWNASEKEREKIRALIRSGHIDCLHSFGDLATTRAHAARALEELDRHDCRLKVWIDHAQAPTNFGSDIMQGHGDEPGHVAYHADLTTSYGIKYVWRGRVTSVVGQDRPFSLAGVAKRKHPFASLLTLIKETTKTALGRMGSRKYALHSENRLVTPVTLRDGQPTRELLRCNPHWAGVSGADRGDRVDEVLTPSFLDRLVSRRGKCILYAHLGKLGSGEYRQRFNPAVVASFRLLAEYVERREIQVLTTSRLLELCDTSSGAGVAMARSLSPLIFPAL